MEEGSIDEKPFPNWSSVEEVYLLAAKTYQKNRFNTEDLAAIRLGPEASRSALQAESVSLYNILRYASMYGLVEWYSGSEFSVIVLPEETEELWLSAYSDYGRNIREKIVARIEEERKLKLIVKGAETLELEGKEYIIGYVGPDTMSRSIDAFVYNVWDPKKHYGVVLRAWGRHITVAKRIAGELELLADKEEATLKYRVVEEDVYRGEEGGLKGDIYLSIELA